MLATLGPLKEGKRILEVKEAGMAKLDDIVLSLVYIQINFDRTVLG